MAFLPSWLWVIIPWARAPFLSTVTVTRLVATYRMRDGRRTSKVLLEETVTRRSRPWRPPRPCAQKSIDEMSDGAGIFEKGGGISAVSLMIPFTATNKCSAIQIQCNNFLHHDNCIGRSLFCLVFSRLFQTLSCFSALWLNCILIVHRTKLIQL